MNQTLQERIEDYLDGLLDEAETSRFEQDLLKETVAAEFRKALLLRELLAALPPDAPPPELVQRIETAVAAAAGGPWAARESAADKGLDRLIKALKTGLGWPEYATAAVAGSSSALKGSLRGMQTLEFMLGPLREPTRKRMQAILRPRKPLWKRALQSGLRGILS